MRLFLAAGLLACTSVQAYSDSSPFILFSTSKFDTPANDAQLQTSAQVLASARDILGSCPTSRYIVVGQATASADDIRTAAGCALPNLCQALASDKVSGRFAVAEVFGEMGNHNLTSHIRASCAAKGHPDAAVEEFNLPALPSGVDERATMLVHSDDFIGRLLEKAEAGGDYTVIFFSQQTEADARPHQSTYEAEFQEPLHMELKRHSGPATIARRNSTVPDNGGLFEKYQFFTPAIFMTFIALFVMLSILYVGISAISSLEVSYGAFDKENGPSAQKK